jgi:hypothetical protein
MGWNAFSVPSERCCAAVGAEEASPRRSPSSMLMWPNSWTRRRFCDSPLACFFLKTPSFRPPEEGGNFFFRTEFICSLLKKKHG